MNKLIFLVLLFAGQVYAESAATVLFVEKKVVASHNGSEHSLSRGSSVDVGDTIITGEGAHANIRYTNGTLVNIGSGSNYKIVAYAPKSSGVQVDAQLNLGKIHVKTAGKEKESLKTPVVSLAILGTEFNVYVPSPKTTYLNVIYGTVEARDQVFIGGRSVLITSSSITNSNFPKEGRVGAPIGAPGTISTTSGGGGTSTTYASGGTGGVDPQTAATASSVQVTGSTTSSSVASTSALAVISAVCSG